MTNFFKNKILSKSLAILLLIATIATFVSCDFGGNSADNTGAGKNESVTTQAQSTSAETSADTSASTSGNTTEESSLKESETSLGSTESASAEAGTSAPDSSAASSDTESTSGSDSSSDSDSSEDFIFDLSKIPAWSGNAYVALNGNKPPFAESEITATAFEKYGTLDSLGRTPLAFACLGRETMPAEDEERGSISNVTPSGWKQAQYDIISGKYLYNRCHLIGWQLSAENANKSNLITGTKYLNIEGMLPFENMVADYIKETGNHVMYRITPIYDGNNLLPSGVQMEAYSVEDSGEGICFNVYCYNVQPSISINYKDGSSALGDLPPETSGETSDIAVADSYVLNTSSKKIHKPSCSSANKISAANRQEHTGSLDSLITQGYSTCGICFK